MTGTTNDRLIDYPYEMSFSCIEEVKLFLYQKGESGIAGLDEVGRGPLVGPVVACCILLPEDHKIKGIKDSKKLTPAKREDLFQQITEVSQYGIGIVSPVDIDRMNIYQATHKACAEAISQCLGIKLLLCDGGLNFQDKYPFPAFSIIKGDAWLECIGAASIVAKVVRDSMMASLHEEWPEYNFQSNQGYGTREHLAAIDKYGITPLHRRSFGVCRTAKLREQ